MDPALGIDTSATLAAAIAPVAPILPVVPLITPSLTRDSFNSQSLGRGLNAHVKQVSARTQSLLSSLLHPTTRARDSTSLAGTGNRRWSPETELDASFPSSAHIHSRSLYPFSRLPKSFITSFAILAHNLPRNIL